jgi:hypothetical protein
MSTPFLTFQKFNDSDLAAAVGEQLAVAGIAYIVENEARHYDPVLIANVPEPTVHLKIPATEFLQANAVLEAYYEKQLQEVDPDYYLLTFTDAELLEILSKPDEWGHFDYVLAKKLLTDRGHNITDASTQQLKSQRLTELAQYEDPPMTGRGGSPIGFGGIISSSIVATHKKTLPDGRQVHAYSPTARKRGKIFFIIAAFALVLLLLARLAQMHG